MLDIVALNTEISLCFARSANLRTLVPGLADSLGAHLPVVEIEGAWLDLTEKSVQLRAFAPGVQRSWSGERSRRYLERKSVTAPIWADYPDPARVASSPVNARLELPVGRAGLLSIGFSSEMSVDPSSDPNNDPGTEIWVQNLAAHCRRLGQLDATARIARQAHRDIVALEARLEALEIVRDTEISRSRSDTSVARAITEIPPQRSTGGLPSPASSVPSSSDTEMPVTTMQDAVVECISRALHASRGRIYGDQGAAELLGLKPSTLQSKMRKLGISRERFV